MKARELLDSMGPDVTVVAVSKLQPVESIKFLFESTGHRNFGENYVQEGLSKIEALKHLPLIWHFIGHLQSNKAKLVVQNFDVIHSVDSVKLLDRIERLARELDRKPQIFMQINVAQENSKEGMSEAEFLQHDWVQWNSRAQAKVVGLMTMPPLVDKPGDNSIYFLRLKNLASQKGLPLLSMGTSSDYREAINCGATHIRIGTLLFGERPKK